MKIFCLFFFYFLFFSFPTKSQSRMDAGLNAAEWNGFNLDSIRSTLDGKIQRFYFYKSSKKNMPLVVSLHQWSADYSTYKNSLAPQAKVKDWNFIHPDFRGPNNNPKACGSNYVISDIDEAIDWAIKNLEADPKCIYIVGASGGGYAALCHFMKSSRKVKEYSVWVPITDLGRWYFESKVRGSKYANDVISCTCNTCVAPNFDESKKRSPMYQKTPLGKLKDCKLKIYAGIHDGYTGAVPIVHSVLFYNKIIGALGGEESEKVPLDDLCWMLTTQNSLNEVTGKLGDRDILYYKAYQNVSVTIFEGTHEILIDEVLPVLF